MTNLYYKRGIVYQKRGIVHLKYEFGSGCMANEAVHLIVSRATVRGRVFKGPGARSTGE